MRGPGESAVVCLRHLGAPTDPQAGIDLRAGLAPLRAPWIEERADTRELAEFSSEYTRRRQRDPRLDSMRFTHGRKPLVAREGANVTQMHYARQGIITPRWNSSPSARMPKGRR